MPITVLSEALVRGLNFIADSRNIIGVRDFELHKSECHIPLHAGLLSIIPAVPAEMRKAFFEEYRNLVREAFDDPAVKPDEVSLPTVGVLVVEFADLKSSIFGTVSFAPVIRLMVGADTISLKGLSEGARKKDENVSGSRYALSFKNKNQVAHVVSHMLEHWVTGAASAWGTEGRAAKAWLEYLLTHFERLFFGFEQREDFPANVFFPDRTFRWFLGAMGEKTLEQIEDAALRDACLSITGGMKDPHDIWATFMVSLDLKEKDPPLTVHGVFPSKFYETIPDRELALRRDLLFSAYVPREYILHVNGDKASGIPSHFKSSREYARKIATALGRLPKTVVRD